MLVEHNGREWCKKSVRKYVQFDGDEKGESMLVAYTLDGEEKVKTRCEHCMRNIWLPKRASLKFIMPMTERNVKAHLGLQTSYECDICTKSLNLSKEAQYACSL
jgi:hypothetical protein